MMQVLSQLISAALGSVGFGLIFNLNRRYLPAAAVGGFLAWLAYLLADHALSSVFLANLLWPVFVPPSMPRSLPGAAMRLPRRFSSHRPFPSSPAARFTTA